MSKTNNNAQMNSNNGVEKDKYSYQNKDKSIDDKTKKKVNFDNSFEQSINDLSLSQYNNNTNYNSNKNKEINKGNKEETTETNKNNSKENLKEKNLDFKDKIIENKKEFDPAFQSQELLTMQNKYNEIDSYDNFGEKLGSNFSSSEINNNHYPTNRGAYYSKMDLAEKDYLVLMKKFEKLVLIDENIEKLDKNRDYDQEIELLKKQNFKLIKNLEKMNDILDTVVDFSKLTLKNPNFSKGKKYEKQDKKRENYNRNSLSKSSQLTANIGDNRLVDVYKQEYLKYLKRYETVSQDHYMNKVEENLFLLNNEIDTITKENKALSYKQKSSECKFELRNSLKINSGLVSDLTITSYDYNNQKKLLDEVIDKIDKNKFDIKNNEEKISELTLKYNKIKEIAGFYNISEENISKINTIKAKQNMVKIEKFSLTNKMNILYNASNSIKKKFEQMILKNEKSIFHLKNIKLQSINYYNIKSAILDELSKQVKNLNEIRSTYEDEKFLRCLQEEDDNQLNFYMLNNNLRRSVDNLPTRNIIPQYDEKISREKTKLERLQYLPKEEVDLIYSLDNAKHFLKDYQQQKNLKSIYSTEEPIEYENDEDFDKRMNELKQNLSNVESEAKELDNVNEKLEKEIIEKYSSKYQKNEKTKLKEKEEDKYSEVNKEKSNNAEKNEKVKTKEKIFKEDLGNSSSEMSNKKSEEKTKDSNEINLKKEKTKNIEFIEDTKNIIKESKESESKIEKVKKEKTENYLKLEKDKETNKLNKNAKEENPTEKSAKKIEEIKENGDNDNASSTIENKDDKNMIKVKKNEIQETKDNIGKNKKENKKIIKNDIDDLII